MAAHVSAVNRPCLRRIASIAAAVAVVAFTHVSASQLAPAREYEIKAAFLVYFASFIDWPESVFTSSTDDLRLEVIGHDPFDGALDRLAAGQSINQRRVVIVYSTRASAQPRGHMVFVSASERKQAPSLLAALNGTPTLTVSDIDRFAEQGGVIGLAENGQGVRFVINRAAASRAGLRVSSKLLSLATLLDHDSFGSTALVTGSPDSATK